MEPSAAKGRAQGRLLVSTSLDAKDELEERLERCVSITTSITNGLSEREANDALTAHCYRDLTLVNRDGMNVVLIKINQILMEKFLKLQDQCRTQLVWLVRELVKSGVIGADGVLMTLMKQIAGGDITSKNVWLAENVLDILVDQREWVLKSGMLVAMSVYTYLRLIVDHGTQGLLALRQREVDFCIGLLRERFMECFIIGRDLVRLLQNVARIPEMELLWRDLLHNPQSLSPQFTGGCTWVRFGQQKRYQDWFQRQYLSTAESQSLRCDLIRYICGVVHPSNEVLSSDILPRWAIIGWLLTTCTSNVAASNAKLALFYDWLFFNPEKDSIMNIEPAILVMHHSMKPHPAITATLLDFIHLAPLFDNPKLDRELRTMLRERFPEFCNSPSPPTEVKMEESVPLEMDNHMLDKEDGCYDNTDATFSDDEEELNNKGKKREFRFQHIKETYIEEPADITPYVDQLDETLKEKVLQLQKGSDTETQCEVMQEIVDLILEEDFDSEQMSTLASCLAELFKSHFRGDVLPEEITEESLEESVCKPVCLIFRNLCQMQEDNSGFSVLLDMLAELYQKQPKIGYHLLYYLKASKAAAGKMSLYESFAQATALGDLHTCLMMDMKACQEDDVRLLCYLTPSIYTEFPDETLRSGELLNMIVAVIDSTQLQELICGSRHDEHPEALSCLLLQLRRESPTEEMVKMVLSRPCHPEDQFTTSILRHWAAKHDDQLAEHIKALLIKNNNMPRKRQSLRSSSSKLAQLTLEQMLEHLDSLRLSLSNTKNNSSCDEAHKMRFSDLFSLAEDYEDSSKPPKSRRKAPASSPRSRKGAAPPANNEEDSGSSSASEEEDTKPKAPKRKRKGSSAVGSDSD
ncbi:Integrator complex subunit 3 [Bagarius yarrelli]|uniref:Integrator complex subunit 3 n=1 Tax=Bagarius yarrelli TaxID=175774 RepID=A0A556TP41_BAGYA|nr:Integrator complex subunit 3 [Bagarius yarrelli]